MSASYRTLVVIANMGLHYVDNPEKRFSRQDYQQQMTAALTYMHNFAIEMEQPLQHSSSSSDHSHHHNKRIHIIWRETSAQHFSTLNGYWPGIRFSHSLQRRCVPIKDPSPHADWRNRDIEDIISSKGLHKIRILRFYNTTVPLWSSHPNGHLRDCTHFCW